MSNIYYTSLSGMMAAGFGLQNTSNNVSNMQSPGFKRSDVFYSSLGYDQNFGGLGSGVTLGGTATNFSDGSYRQTSNPSDLAVLGQGFFIVKLKNGEYLYTRDGEFVFDDNDILIDRHSQGVVQGYDSSGHLAAIHGKGPESAPGKETNHVYLKGKWVVEWEVPDDNETPGPDIPNPDPNKPSNSAQLENKKGHYKNVTFQIATIYDEQGNAHTVTFEFESTNNPEPPSSGNAPVTGGDEWILSKVTCDGDELYFEPDQYIKFNDKSRGYPNEEFSSFNFMFNSNQKVNVHLGSKMDDSDSSVNSADVSEEPESKYEGILVKDQDGYGIGKQISFSFDENGQIIYKYDNGQEIEGIHIGLARFDEMENTLVQTRDNLFRAKNNKGLHIGQANKKGFGSILSSQIESSNVNATNEFANIVILQRMFQACSQIMEIDKQLIDELNRGK